MKKLLIVLGMFLLVGGGVAALWFFKVPPFGKPAKKEAVAVKGKGGGKRTAAPAVAQNTTPSPVEPEPSTPPPAKEAAVNDAKEPVKEPVKKAAPPAAQMSEADLNRLAGVYEQMPVDEATKIMTKLPDTLVEPLLRRMDEKQVGKLLTTFSPERAAKLTLAMAKSANPSLASAP